MFNLKKKQANDVPVLNGLLGIGSEFEGEILFEGLFRVDGCITGRLICNTSKPSVVIVSKDAVVDADIVADQVITSGRIMGNVLAFEKVEIFSPGRLEGNVFTNNLILNHGALFQGESIMLKNLAQEQREQLEKDFVENTFSGILDFNGSIKKIGA